RTPPGFCPSHFSWLAIMVTSSCGVIHPPSTSWEGRGIGPDHAERNAGPYAIPPAAARQSRPSTAPRAQAAPLADAVATEARPHLVQETLDPLPGQGGRGEEVRHDRAGFR